MGSSYASYRAKGIRDLLYGKNGTKGMRTNGMEYAVTALEWGAD